jgi:glycosyltransferase involved in cell wall biosynthesis
MSCPAAWLIGRFTCCRVLYHEHDSPSEPNGESRKWKVEIGKAEMLKGQSMEWKADNGRQTTDDRPPVSSFQRFLLWTRKRAGREAELVVLPNQTRLELFQQTTGRKKPSLCIFNCPRLEEVRSSKTEPCSEGRLRLAFHGSINRDRLPMALLPALAQLQGTVELQIIGYTTIDSSDYLTRFVAEAERLGIKPLISLMGTVPQREKLLELASRADVGLAVMPLQGGDVNMANMTGASNKPFDYLACGLALLVSDLPDWRKMFVEPGYGLACDPADPESIAKALRLFTEHPKETREMGERGRQRILSEWNYESQFAPVINQL